VPHSFDSCFFSRYKFSSLFITFSSSLLSSDCIDFEGSLFQDLLNLEAASFDDLDFSLSFGTLIVQEFA
jgi:hypothetical protein